MSVRPSVFPHVLERLPLADFVEIWYLWKSVEEFQIWLKSDNPLRHFAWRSKNVLLLPATLSYRKSSPFKWNDTRFLRQTTRYEHYANAPHCTLHAQCLSCYVMSLRTVSLVGLVCVFMFLHSFLLFLRGSQTGSWSSRYFAHSGLCVPRCVCRPVFVMRRVVDPCHKNFLVRFPLQDRSHVLSQVSVWQS
jgi:hypothetical protein